MTDEEFRAAVLRDIRAAIKAVNDHYGETVAIDDGSEFGLVISAAVPKTPSPAQ